MHGSIFTSDWGYKGEYIAKSEVDWPRPPLAVVAGCWGVLPGRVFGAAVPLAGWSRRRGCRALAMVPSARSCRRRDDPGRGTTGPAQPTPADGPGTRPPAPVARSGGLAVGAVVRVRTTPGPAAANHERAHGGRGGVCGCGGPRARGGCRPSIGRAPEPKPPPIVRRRTIPPASGAALASCRRRRYCSRLSARGFR